MNRLMVHSIFPLISSVGPPLLTISKNIVFATNSLNLFVELFVLRHCQNILLRGSCHPTYLIHMSS